MLSSWLTAQAAEPVFSGPRRRLDDLRRWRSIGPILPLVVLILLSLLWVGNSFAQSTFANFESPQAHSIAISKTGDRLFALNTPANSLLVYSLKDPANPVKIAEIPVGLGPVSMAVRSEKEVYVVNHLSDTVSVVDIDRKVVMGTVIVGKRPGDIVLVEDVPGRGEEPEFAYVTSMAERAVWFFYLFDLEDREPPDLVEIIPIEGHEPRTLLVSSDGKKVWVATYRSGNRTTVVPHQIAPQPPAPTNPALPPAPPQGIIVDATDPAWTDSIKVELADADLFEIGESDGSLSYRSLGTVLFNLAENPADGSLWIANTEARNRVRFEPELKGHAVDNRLTIIPQNLGPPISKMVVGKMVTVRDELNEPPLFVDLNPGLDYERLPNPEALQTALAQPTDIVFDPQRDRAYVAAFGTDRIGVMQPSTREVVSRIDLGTPGAATEPRTKRGPRAMAIHPQGSHLYVLNRLSNSVTTVDLQQQQVASETEMTDPTPVAIREGRGYLFDAKLSGNGTVSCASCHIDGDRDGLAWDLGDPGGQMFNNGSAMPAHPMKGPLLTQTLKGLAGERIFHWRADRPGLESFNSTFANLLGGQELEEDDLETFVEYLSSIRFAPNTPPNQWVDPESRKAKRQVKRVKLGEQIFKNRLAMGREEKNRFRCIDCHKNPSGSGGSGFTGLIGQSTKVAQLRGLQQRTVFTEGGSRVNGFGYGADGSQASLVDFLADSHRFDRISDEEKIALQEYLFTFPTETPVVVGMNRTIRFANFDDREIRPDLQKMIEGARLGHCQLILTGLLNGKRVRLTFNPTDEVFQSVDQADQPMTLDEILDTISQDEEDDVVSFLALPWN
ncbi:MAG: beta-propeller fold lactonase family protein [Mariniblastus sp.]|nr:beta-propeller fold lactonase family protein [Mariniblastus sp.]